MAKVKPRKSIIESGVDRLPSWAKVIFYILVVIGSVYCIAREGFGSFLLHAIFSPMP
jgi:hypothetical protein